MLRTIARRTTYTIAGTAAIGGSTITAYTNTEEGKGLRRQISFWSHLTPIIADYFIQTSSRSPYVQLQKFLCFNDVKEEEEDDEKRFQKKRNEKLNELHNKHAPELLDTLQTLGGLYIKLGQVLSVTALPIPQRYKEEFRVLQSDVPGHQDYDSVIKPMIERELGHKVEDLFDDIEPVPCGAASIGQAHKAKLKRQHEKDDNCKDEKKDDQYFDVVIKVQYPHAAWQVPADILCLGQFLKICVWADVVDETSAQLSYDEFSRQFLSELDYNTEMDNLRLIHESSLDLVNAPYHRRNVMVPKVYEQLCSDKVITMEYIPGPKIESEARKQLELMGIKTDRRINDIVNEAVEETKQLENGSFDPSNKGSISSKKKSTWKTGALNLIGNVVGVDTILWIIRSIRRIVFLSQASTVALIKSAPQSFIPSSWNDWADANEAAAAYAATLNLTKEWVDALFDVHGHQIFSLGCFNADCHPGNILVVQDKESGLPTNKLGLIDFGQCKRLNTEEQFVIAKLILSIANNESDEMIANNFRAMGVKTREDSTKFLAEFSKLMFGKFQPKHMDHAWHMDLHHMDKVLYFPKELSMVYRTSLLLRGLALSLQMNSCVAEQWKSHAQTVVRRHKKEEGKQN